MDSMGVTTMNNKEEAVEVCTVVELPENTLWYKLKNCSDSPITVCKH